VPSTPFCFAISASFTAETIQPFIEFWGNRLSSDFEVSFAPYHQISQTLLDPHSVFGVNQHGLNVLLMRLEDVGPTGGIEAHTNELIHLIRDSAARFSVPLLVCLCPSSPHFLSDPDRARLNRELCSRIEGSLDDLPGVQFLSPEEIHHLYPVDAPHDPDGEHLARIPYTELYFCALATTVVRHAHALFTPPYKVVALDCDNTLWQGICGEDGPTGIVVDPPRRFLQEFMLDQREEGMLLVMNSKNNEQDVLDTFAANPQMPLQLRHFVGSRLNWESKSANLAALAAELSLGPDSFIFVDDSPKECAEMAENAPEVLALPLPENIGRTPEFLKHVWAFDHPVVTEEDRHRSAYYTQAQEFGREVKRASNLEEFVAGLRLQVTFSPLAEERLSRAAQLTQRTNQFNFTTIRRSEREIQTLTAERGYECVTVEVSDRFGSYGLVGVLIFRAVDSALEIDTFLVSCRVLGRGVEHRMLAWLGEQAAARGLAAVVARIEITRKNKPAQQFLRAIDHGGEGPEYRFDAERIRTLRWTPATSVEVPKQAPKPASPSPRRLVDYASIANELATPAQILEAMRRESQAANGPSGHAGMTSIERQLAGVWSDLLKCSKIAVSDNFFDLGGHSLLAVLLIGKVREAFGVELSIDDVYSATLTLGELARKIETYQLGQLNPEEYDALLAEIEGLSDEEVQALLSKEDAN
jgi:FkbH-like protein